MKSPLRYGIKYLPDTGAIEAGAVRQVGPIGVDAFVLSSDATGQAVVSVARWLIATSKHRPYRIVSGGITYELTARIIDE